MSFTLETKDLIREALEQHLAAMRASGEWLRCSPKGCGIIEFTPTGFAPKCARDRLVGQSGQVGEWLKPTDCKSVTPCELRRFESFPVHQF